MFELLGFNQKDLRDRNRRLVLTVLRMKGVLSKGDIARMTGLSIQTVSVISRELEEEGLVLRGEKRRGKIGQPSVPLQLAAEGAHFVGLEIGQKSIGLILVDFVGKILDRVRVTDEHFTPEKALNSARSAADELSGSLSQSQREKISGIGISSALSETGNCPETWSEVRTRLGVRNDCPIYFGREGSCACNAELIFGTQNARKDFLYIHLGDQVDGGLALDGHLHEGSSGNAGSIAWFPLARRDGTASQLSDKCSLDSLKKQLVKAGSDPGRLWTKPVRWDDLSEPVTRWLDEAAPAIAQAIIGANTIIDFPYAIIDGPIPERLRKKIAEMTGECLSSSSFGNLNEPDIVQGSLGLDAVVLGAASLPLSKQFMFNA